MYIMQEYDNALKFILENGERRSNRTGVDCLTVYSMTQTYRIDEYFPLLTKRKLYPKAVFAELLWMLSGSTDNDELIKLGANFWTPWVDESHPENKKFYERTRFRKGLLGPVYGFQMRYFGAPYQPGMENRGFGQTDGIDVGVDQIKWLIEEIKINPDSRRLIVSLWNPADLHIMRLPPCHYCFHVFIDGKGRMSLLLNQRSCDFPVGVPANIQFYSALCYMLAQQTGYTPYQFIHHTEDSHIYMNQIDSVNEYLSREAKPSPKMKLNKAKDIFSYQTDDFQTQGYDPHPPIKVMVTV
jgi:thymidylate synthase